MALSHKRPHTSCRRGKKVRIELYPVGDEKEGKIIIGKFWDSTARHIELQGGQQILKKDVKNFGFYREKGEG